VCTDNEASGKRDSIKFGAKQAQYRQKFLKRRKGKETNYDRVEALFRAWWRGGGGGGGGAIKELERTLVIPGSKVVRSLLTDHLMARRKCCKGDKEEGGKNGDSFR